MFNREFRGTAKEVLYQLRDPQGLTPYRLWSSSAPATEDDRVALAAFYLFDLDSTLVDHHIAVGERARLRVLRSLLKIAEGELLRCQHEEVERIVQREIGEIVLDDLVTPIEALRQVDLQEALGLSYDEYSGLTASTIEQKIRPWLLEAKGRMPLAEFQRRLAALDSLILLPPDPARP